MRKQTYRTLRRHGAHDAGAELSLTEDEAIRMNNESPGVLEGPIEVKAEARAVEAPAKPIEDAKPAKANP